MLAVIIRITYSYYCWKFNESNLMKVK